MKPYEIAFERKDYINDKGELIKKDLLWLRPHPEQFFTISYPLE